ncbi:MAG: carbohydrate ABC transporter permease [Cetobacterium somerae]|uniref:carbohydrate ABC transporter permease n=1 Tax=Cetobacterium TaxID=180162 RepID=UPI00163BC909|nr:MULTISPECIES: carbohydrate ABC transporter permease [Cetobacterium]MBC2854196.1 carbohydrate ABC transporter permease [Cetobacterium sp. 2G large]MCQ9625912.1 carbohydrate ABC transporter permease [Cetobacterium somerae]MCX3068115.1 carbohydrate ABC transporter permease [Cetobacterium somerae]WVJ00641.1 carbohydrate ABC transporter permease [Cetobacterium somerae]
MSKIKRSKDEKIFDFINYSLLAIFGIMFIYPIIYVFSASVTKPYLLEIGEMYLLPKGISMASFKAAMSLDGIWLAYANSIFITVVGTAVSMFFTITGAYVLSKPELKFRKILTLMVVVTMWFDPGMIPRYLNFRDLGLINSYTSVIVGFAVNTFNVIILKSFFEAVPKSLEESARIDGATQWQIMTKIYLPLSTSALTTVSLFYAISRWNGYFWTMVLLTDDSKVPLQVFLKKLIVEKNMAGEAAQIITPESLTSPQSIIYAVIVLSIVPIMIIYPFIQKFFRKGVTLGAVKE